jgi:hypothetical protein
VAGLKVRAEGFELSTQFGEIVDLAIKDDREGTISRAHRLVAAVEIEHSESLVGKVNSARVVFE